MSEIDRDVGREFVVIRDKLQYLMARTSNIDDEKAEKYLAQLIIDVLRGYNPTKRKEVLELVESGLNGD